MVAKVITSLQHPIVKQLTSIRKDKSARDEINKVLICGEALTNELSQNFQVDTLIIEEGKKFSKFNAKNVIETTQEVLKKISGLKNPPESIALFEKPSHQVPENIQRILVLDRVSDPGNLGTLIRTAMSLGWQAIYLIGNGCDPYNEKALRASKAGPFFIPIIEGDTTKLSKLLKSENITLYTANLHGKSIHDFKVSIDRIALLLGNEGEGPSTWAKQHGKPVTIPMQPHAESLNVAVAGAIMMDRLGGIHK